MRDISLHPNCCQGISIKIPSIFLLLACFITLFYLSYAEPLEDKTSPATNESIPEVTCSVFILEAATDRAITSGELVLLNRLQTFPIPASGQVTIPLTKELLKESLKLVVVAPGYEQLKKSIEPGELKANPLVILRLTAKEKEKKIKKLQEILVKGERRVTSSQTIENRQLRENVQVNFNDVLATLKTKPGLSYSGSSFDNSLYIQGGDDQEWIAILDHVYILNPGGWNNRVSIFNPLTIESIELYTAGYPAAIGNGLSGVLWLKSIVPDREKWNFYFGLDNALEAMAHGPLGKRASMSVQLRRTLVEIFAPFEATDDFRVEQPYLWDSQLKFNFELSDNDFGQILFAYFRDGLTLDVNSFVGTSDFNGDLNNRRDTGEAIQFTYNNNRIIGSLKYVHHFRSDNFVVATASIIPQIAYYNQEDDGLSAFTVEQNDFPFQFTLDYTHGSIKRPPPVQRRDGLFFKGRGRV